MTTLGLLVQLEAKPGREDEVAEFLKAGQALVAQEPGTMAWFGVRMGPSTFGIFDAFDDAAGRDAHLSGPVAEALMTSDLFAGPPSIVKVDVLADKLPK
ncbi:MAG: antibiotic biosynthesis monooxygenase [Acidimicrobiales bacterium]|nr:MAG: antibiotic biosynthesis monooxygenase [Acidimicrobiales bacterium]